MSSYDAIFVGSGINSLVGAALLAKAGWKVLVLERNSWLGGAIRSEEITEPGFVHDLYSAWHPLFTGGGAYALLKDDLHAYGLEYLNTDLPTASLFPDGSTAFLSTSQEENCKEFDRLATGDGAAWEATVSSFLEHADLAFGLLGTELWSWEGMRLVTRGLRRMGVRGSLDFTHELLASSRDWLASTFSSPQVHGLLAPWVLHTGLGPDSATSGFMNKLIAVALQLGGMPVPRGGGARLVDALKRVIEKHGGELWTSVHVERIMVGEGRATGVETTSGSFPATRAVVCSVTPHQLYLRLLDEKQVRPWVRERTRRFRYGRADMQIHLALSQPPPWPQEGERLRSTAIIHVTAGLDATSRAVNEAERGLIPADPTIVLGQPMAVDPSRAPEGKWIFWIQLQELPSRPRGDAAGEFDVGDGRWTESLRERYADRVLDKLKRHLPGLESSIQKRVVLSPADLEKANINLVGGDPYAGACAPDQFFIWRPLPGLPRHRTPVPRLYHIGASTHPGPGLHGGSGLLVAKELLGPKGVKRLGGS